MPAVVKLHAVLFNHVVHSHLVIASNKLKAFHFIASNFSNIRGSSDAIVVAVML